MTETTFGLPRYVLPPREEVWEQVLTFCRETLEEGFTPMLMAYSLGKCQAVLAGLRESGLTFALHEQAWRMTEAYAAGGIAMADYELFAPENLHGKVLIWPPSVLRSKLLHGLPPMRKAVITGWAMDSSCRYRYRADAAFAVSDHADFPELLEAVKRVQPQMVWTLHGSAAAFADTLRHRGYQAAALSEPDQLSLLLG